MFLFQLTQRVRKAVSEKAQKVSSIGIDVTPEAQSLFNSIKKTYVRHIKQFLSDEIGLIRETSLPKYYYTVFSTVKKT